MKILAIASHITLLLHLRISSVYALPTESSHCVASNVYSRGSNDVWNSGCDGPSTRDLNDKGNRQKWLLGFDIDTDYENSWPRDGKIRCFDLTVSRKLIYPDGYEKLAMVVNGQYPGPPIIVNWGDTVRVRVTNKLDNGNGTAMHFHGLRQLNNNLKDGVPGVTQCPIMPGSSQVYEFIATEYGTSWYHSHFAMQYPEGVAGPLIVRGPTSANYDEDLGAFAVADWFHVGAMSKPFHLLGDSAPQPPDDSSLINGKGIFNCSAATDPKCKPELGGLTEVNMEKGKKYKMRLVSMATGDRFIWWMDGHEMTVVAADFVPVKPYKTDAVVVGPGQRYDIIVEAKADTSESPDFWINMHFCISPPSSSSSAPSGNTAPVGAPSGGPPAFIVETHRGIIRYAGGKGTPPRDRDSNNRSNSSCHDPFGDTLTPIVPKRVGANKDGKMTQLLAGAFPWPDQTNNASQLHTWALGDASLHLNWSEPAVKLLDEGKNLPFNYVPQSLSPREGDWNYVLVLDNFTSANNPPRGKVNEFPVFHPIHLHGHDFSILAQGVGDFDANKVKLNLENPPRRDTAMLPEGGYLLIGFQTNNPGVWLLHCHIAWHSSSGMAVPFIELPDKLKNQLRTSAASDHTAMLDQCKAWTKNYNTAEDGSGI